MIQPPGQHASDFVVQFGRVVGSSVSDETGALLFNVEGLAGEAGEPEGTSGVEVYGALGLMGRPLPPDQRGGRQQHADVVCVRTADALVPVATRDTRIRMGGRGPAAGTIALAGYGGGFYALSAVAAGDDPSGAGTAHLLYCPYDFGPDGVPRRAHAVVLDPQPGNESVQLIHGSGMAITMQQGAGNPLLIKNAAGDTTLRLDDAGVTITSGQVVISGGVVLGEPAAAVSPVVLAVPMEAVMSALMLALGQYATTLGAGGPLLPVTGAAAAAAAGTLASALGAVSAQLATIAATRVNAS